MRECYHQPKVLQFQAALWEWYKDPGVFLSSSVSVSGEAFGLQLECWRSVSPTAPVFFVCLKVSAEEGHEHKGLEEVKEEEEEEEEEEEKGTEMFEKSGNSRGIRQHSRAGDASCRAASLSSRHHHRDT
ncbi:hypothetical protein O3P69_013956 [Scylla paramamosain]|uniref:Uncharacterized protein n=1 Tax=Scylla paramamosain TaxID=85552 RepID=A0AAW0SSG1_SCYPA